MPASSLSRRDLTIVHVVGARPNFMKIAPLLRALEGDGSSAGPPLRNLLIHTGQHYDRNMSGSFFADLRIRAPDRSLGVGSGTHATQTARVMLALEPILLQERPVLVVVVGDVNSTVAAALTAAKLQVPIAHVEAGLRSRDRNMPEELNRILTDQLSEFLFTPSSDADENLRREGIPEQRIRNVGNIMIDTLLEFLPRAREEGVPARFGLDPGDYAVVTLHRPSNVDDPERLGEIFRALDEIAGDLPVMFPIHPRTARNAEEFGISLDRARPVEPLGYLEMLGLIDGAAFVVTDSGGIQEETTALDVPCLTLRSTTERPITIQQGTNRLVPVRTRQRILKAYADIRNDPPTGRRPDLWDGRTAERIARVIVQTMEAIASNQRRGD